MLKKIIFGISIFMILFNFAGGVFAVEITNANLVKVGEADYHLKYFKEDRGYSSYIICSIIGYKNKEKFYPAYCMNKDLPGAESGEYTVNISELINNPSVWRVVTNGYPYLEPYQMGLENEFDAYTVTKHAVYCVLGQTKIENYSYDENDIVGHRMYDVLKYLVNLGLNGSDIPSNSNLNINKLDDLKELDDFYYQEYVVDSKIDIKSYNVQISNFPNSCYISNINNNPQTVFNKGENFRVLIPKSEVTNDINGNIEIESEVQDYPIFYGEAPDGKQDYVITYDTYGNEKYSIDFNLKVNTGKLEILKIDEATKEPIDGVKFELINKEKNEIYENITDSNGKIILNNLYPGEYILREIETLDKYDINEQEFEIKIEYNKTSEITISNKLKKGKIKIVKVDEENERISGIKFELYDSNMKLLEELETNENGEVISNEYPRIGEKYYLKEVQGKDGYILNDELIEIDFNDMEIIEVVVKNNKAPIEEDIDTQEEIFVEQIKKLPKTGM